MDVLDIDIEEKEDKQGNNKFNDQPVIVQILIAIGLTFVLMTLVQFLSDAIIKGNYGLSITDITANLDSFLKEFGDRLNSLRYAQMLNTIFSFGGAAFIMSYLLTRKPFGFFKSEQNAHPSSLILIPVMMVSVIPLAGAIQHYISMINFPEWLVNMQELALELQTIMLGDTRISIFAINLIMIAVLPAIFEELLFRGILQPLFIKLTDNHHFGIIITGFVFGLIHMQIINLLPIAILGILLGYIYHWTKNIWFPIFAHFFFNGLQALVYFLSSKNLMGENVQELEMLPWSYTLMSLVVFAGVTYLFYTANQKRIYGQG